MTKSLVELFLEPKDLQKAVSGASGPPLLVILDSRLGSLGTWVAQVVGKSKSPGGRLLLFVSFGLPWGNINMFPGYRLV